MQLNIRNLTDNIGAEVMGIDLALQEPEACARTLREALLEHGVLVIRGQEIDDARQVACSRCFGPLEITTVAEHRDKRFPEIMMVADVGDTSKYLSASLFWHTDSSYRPVTAYVSALRAITIAPDGGETWFANTQAGYAALPDSRKRDLDGLEVVHDLQHTRSLIPGLPPFTPEEAAKVPPAVHPLARVHAGTGKKVIYLGCHAREVVGMPLESGQALLRELLDWTTQTQFVYRHKWQPGDLVIWDNRGLLHKVTPYDAARYRRVMHRTVVSDALAA
jgi:alpha-ketoglutarate-dependent taurine dioxygenase